MNTKFNFIVDEFESESPYTSYADVLQSLKSCQFANIIIERLNSQPSNKLLVPINLHDAAYTVTHDFQLHLCETHERPKNNHDDYAAVAECKKITFCGHSEKQICDIILRFKKCIIKITELTDHRHFQNNEDPHIFRKKEFLIFYESLTVNADDIYSLSIWTLIRELPKFYYSNTTTKFQLILGDAPSKCNTCKYHSNLIPCDNPHCNETSAEIGDWSPIDDGIKVRFVFKRVPSVGKITFYTDVSPEALTSRTHTLSEHWNTFIPEHTIVWTNDDIKFETTVNVGLTDLHLNITTKRYEVDVPIRSIDGGAHTNVKAETILNLNKQGPATNLRVTNIEPTSGGNDGYSIPQLLSLSIVNCDSCQNRHISTCSYTFCDHFRYWSPKNLDILKQVQEQLTKGHI